MDDKFLVTCPYCGEAVDVYIEPDVRGSFVQDCEVCCNPWRITVVTGEDGRFVDVARADGSE
jgi:cysteine-rich CPXCG protein